MTKQMTEPMTEIDQRQKKSIVVINIGLIANIILAIGKSIIGVAGRSQALLADGINSTSDVIYFIIVRIYMVLAGKPPDEEHPMGHRQLESIAAIVVGAFVLTTAVAIFWSSINKVYELLKQGTVQEPASMFALYTALATILIKIVLTIYTDKAGKSHKSPTITAIAHDHRNDIFSASAAALGIILGRAGLIWVDPLAGAIVALIILKTGVTIIKESADTLMTVSLGKKLEAQIDETVNSVPGVLGIEEKSYHRYGPYMILNLTIIVNGSISVNEGDAIASAAEETLRENFTFIRHVHIHYHPGSFKKD